MNQAYWTLRLTYGLVPLLAGLDKFTNLLANWPGYVSPLFAGLLPMSPQSFMVVVGIIEVAVGIAVLTRFTHLASYVAAGWLALVAVNLVTAGFIDIAVRDLAMAAGAFALAKITEARADSAGVARVQAHAA